MPEETVFITKASGEKAPFSPTKLRLSLEKAGAGSAIIDQIVSEIEAQPFEGMSTKKIYSHAFSPKVWFGLRYIDFVKSLRVDWLARTASWPDLLPLPCTTSS